MNTGRKNKTTIRGRDRAWRAPFFRSSAQAPLQWDRHILQVVFIERLPVSSTPPSGMTTTMDLAQLAPCREAFPTSSMRWRETMIGQAPACPVATSARLSFQLLRGHYPARQPHDRAADDKHSILGLVAGYDELYGHSTPGDRPTLWHPASPCRFASVATSSPCRRIAMAPRTAEQTSGEERFRNTLAFTSDMRLMICHLLRFLRTKVTFLQLSTRNRWFCEVDGFLGEHFGSSGWQNTIKCIKIFKRNHLEISHLLL